MNFEALMRGSIIGGGVLLIIMVLLGISFLKDIKDIKDNAGLVLSDILRTSDTCAKHSRYCLEQANLTCDTRAQASKSLAEVEKMSTELRQPYLTMTEAVNEFNRTISYAREVRNKATKLKVAKPKARRRA